MEGVWGVVSRDTYKLDVAKHGGAHVDRYRRGSNVGRYRLDGTPIPHNGVIPAPIPASDQQRFQSETAKARGLLGGQNRP
jgi:hypothetical protein